MTYHFNRAQRRAIQAEARKKGIPAEDMTRIMDGLERDVFNERALVALFHKTQQPENN